MTAAAVGGRRLALRATRVAGAALLAAAALATPGLLSGPSILSIIISMSFIGCVTAGMTLITISGNIMSLSLGATAALCALVFAAMLNAVGLVPALLAAALTGSAVSAAQGFVIGRFGANPIIVSIAALSLIEGGAQWAVDGAEIYTKAGLGQEILKTKIAGLPIEFLIYAGAIGITQFFLSCTVFGRNLYMIGSSRRAADAAGARAWRSVVGAYGWAGLFAAIPGVLLTAHYNAGSMDYGLNYDYDAIAAVLVGGNPMTGGQGSALRSAGGVFVITLVQSIVLLHGFREEWQILIVGLVVLGVIVLQAAEA